jgi:hypothetical protein
VPIQGRLVGDPHSNQFVEPLLLIRGPAQVDSPKSRVLLVDLQGLRPELVIGDCSRDPKRTSPVSPFVVHVINDLGNIELVNKRQTLSKDTYLLGCPIRFVGRKGILGTRSRRTSDRRTIILRGPHFTLEESLGGIPGVAGDGSLH